MKRAEILDTAKGYVTRDRAATHGRAEDQFATIAARWGVLLGVNLTPVKVALMMADLKLVRAWTNPAHEDNFVDLAGYAACGGEIATATNLPREGLPFEAVKAERDAARDNALWTPEQIKNALAENAPPHILNMLEPMARALDTEPQPLELPESPEIAPHSAKSDQPATHAAKSGESAPAARVCGGCRWWSRGTFRDIRGALLGYCDMAGQVGQEWTREGFTCGSWQPKPAALAGIAARDATAWQAQDGGVEHNG